IGYGTLISATVHFIIVAFIIYLIIQALKKAARPQEEVAAAEAAEIALLREIRDELRSGRAAPSTSH
ncbi:MAG TPA: MscL family protein, partial [Allosphingosinicella sp.]